MEIPSTLTSALTKHERTGEAHKAKEGVLSTYESAHGGTPKEKDIHGGAKAGGVEGFFGGFKSKLGAPHQEPTSVTVEKIHHGPSAEDEEMLEDDFSEDEAYISPLEEIEGILKQLSELKPVTIIYGKDKKASMGTSILQSNKETLFEDEVPSTVRKLSDAGFLAMGELNIREGLLNLRKAELIINSFLANNGILHHDLIIHTLINLGIAYYKIGFLEEALVCFEDSLICLKSGTSKKKLNPSINANNTNVLHNEYFQQLTNKIKYKRLRCKLHMQCCIVLSEMGKHEEALVHGKYAAKLGRNSVVDSLAYCYHLIIRELNEEKGLRSRSSARNLTKTLREPRALSNNKKRNRSEEHHASMKTSSAAVLPRLASNTGEEHHNEQTLQKDSSKGRLPEKMTESEPLTFQNANGEARTTENKEEDVKESQADQETKPTESKSENKCDIVDYSTRLIPILKLISARLADFKKELGPSKKEFVLGILERACGELKFEEANLKTLTERVSPGHWILGVNILNLLQLKPMSFEDISRTNELEKEIDASFILEKIADVAASLYCCSTETRFLEEKFLSATTKSAVSLPFLESEIWLAKSLEISFIFLPHETPFVGQIISVHNKFHSVLRQPIPEDEEINDNYEYLRPLKGSTKPIFFISIVKKRGKGLHQPKMIDEQAESSFLFKKKLQADSLNPTSTLSKERFSKGSLLEAPQAPQTLGKLRVKKLGALGGPSPTVRKAEALAVLEKIYSADQPTQIPRTTMLINGRSIKKQQEDILRKNEELIRKNDEILKKTEERLRMASDVSNLKKAEEVNPSEQRTPGLPPKPGTGNKHKQIKEGSLGGAQPSTSLSAGLKQVTNPFNNFLNISGENKSGMSSSFRLPQELSKGSSENLKPKKLEGSAPSSNTYNMGVLRKLAAKKKIPPKTQNFMDPEAVTIVNPGKKIKFGEVKNVGIQINNNINLIINPDKNAQNINLEAISRQLNENKIFEKINNNVHIGGASIRIKNKKNFRVVRETNANSAASQEKRDLLSNLVMDKGKETAGKDPRLQFPAGSRKILARTPDSDLTTKSQAE